MQVSELTREQYETALGELTANPPIEQLPEWQDYESTVPGRTFWGYVAFEDAGEVVALAALMQYETHGYRFLRGHHAPVWREEPSEGMERAALDALAAFVRSRDKRQVFARISVLHDLDSTRPVLSTRPYDSTMVIDVTGGDDEILARMKPRGRRDVRKALRESPVECADETELALESFAEYYDVMVETGERDGFVPAPMADYETMMRTLGPERCCVFAGRHEGRVVTWSIVTLSGSTAVRYYAASRNDTMRLHVTDKLVYFECCELGRRGMESYDLMGLGSEFQPALMGLNEFKTKFAKDGVRCVAPDRDIPFRKAFYSSLTRVRDIRDSLRGAGR